MVALAAVPAAAADALLVSLDAWAELSAWLAIVSSLDDAERYFAATWLLIPVFDLLAFSPGIVALCVWRRRFPLQCNPPRARAPLMLASALGCFTLGAGIALHAALDLPSLGQDLGSPEVIAAVPRRLRLVDCAMDSVAPGIIEELYWRGVVYAAARDRLPSWLTILATSLAFAVGHPASLMAAVLGFGLLMGLIRELTGSWLPAAGVHVAWNAVAMAAAWQLL